MVLFPLTWAAIVGTVTIVLAALVYGLPIVWHTAPAAIPVAMLAAAPFAAFGMLFAALAIVFKQAMIGATWLMAGISLVAGFYFPVALLPDWIRWASEVQPFTPAAELLRHLLVGTPMESGVMTDILKLAGFAAVLLPLAAWALSAAIRSAQRRGTIIEY
jgi:ABC-2 type transport system permease protein